MEGVRAGAVAALLLACGGLLGGCGDPYSPAYPENSADVTIEVSPDGRALVKVFLDANDHSNEEILAAGHAATGVLSKPALVDDIFVDENGGGSSYAVVTIEQAFVPGDSPVIGFDTTELVSYLLDQDLASVQVVWRDVDVPNTADWQPPSESRDPGAGFWATVTSSAYAPRGTVTLHPSATLWRAYGAELLPIAGLVLLAGGIGCLVARRHRRAAGLGIAAATCCLVSFALGGYGQTGALAASGGATWPYALDIPMSLISMMLVFPGSVTVMALGFNGVPHPYVVFNSPAGWESGEPGWLPYAGWFPPQHWPAAPKDWQFLTPVRKKKANGNTSRWARAAARAWQDQYRARAALTTEPGPASGR